MMQDEEEVKIKTVPMKIDDDAKETLEAKDEDFETFETFLYPDQTSTTFGQKSNRYKIFDLDQEIGLMKETDVDGSKVWMRILPLPEVSPKSKGRRHRRGFDLMQDYDRKFGIEEWQNRVKTKGTKLTKFPEMQTGKMLCRPKPEMGDLELLVEAVIKNLRALPENDKSEMRMLAKIDGRKSMEARKSMVIPETGLKEVRKMINVGMQKSSRSEKIKNDLVGQLRSLGKQNQVRPGNGSHDDLDHHVKPQQNIGSDNTRAAESLRKEEVKASPRKTIPRLLLLESGEEMYDVTGEKIKKLFDMMQDGKKEKEITGSKKNPETGHRNVPTYIQKHGVAGDDGINEGDLTSVDGWSFTTSFEHKDVEKEDPNKEFVC